MRTWAGRYWPTLAVLFGVAWAVVMMSVSELIHIEAPPAIVAVAVNSATGGFPFGLQPVGRVIFGTWPAWTILGCFAILLPALTFELNKRSRLAAIGLLAFYGLANAWALLNWWNLQLVEVGMRSNCSVCALHYSKTT